MSKFNIGWVGVGNMGAPMAKRLMDAGHSITVLNRPSAKTQNIIAAGASAVENTAQLASQVDYLFTMIPDATVLDEIVSGNEGLFQSTGSIPRALIDMSTIDPTGSARIGALLERSRVGYLRACVTGSTAYAENGTLGIMASGNYALYQEVLPLLKVLGNRHSWLGTAEEARVCKIIINMLLGNLMQALAESLVLGEKNGLPWDTMIDLIADSAAAAPIIKYKVDALKARDFTAMASAQMMEKDLNIALDIAKDSAVSLPETALTRQFYTAMRAEGLEGFDMSGLVLVSEMINGLRDPLQRKQE